MKLMMMMMMMTSISGVIFTIRRAVEWSTWDVGIRDMPCRSFVRLRYIANIWTHQMCSWVKYFTKPNPTHDFTDPIQPNPSSISISY